ncbi:aldo/keto reductase [Natronogracilivirga saccharolytica]|uniref:Aldo/keto reductase n=1 Tax=Natronogracilivirga saccharolytica TaxID=2812953 RepID=A0A8J7RKI9_9BACT|nr:aldo/keto reductase [Natronogracilivirga saccharolytica]MBP3191838.1 aldo/keto reductase [Natronogracilivirga saccharolytica]
MSNGCDRRTFLKKSLATTAGIGLVGTTGIFAKTKAWATEPANGPMPVRPLGKTGHQVSIFSLGGETTIEMADRHDEAVEIINRALDLGVNYIDTAAWYGNGASELNIGAAIKDRRDEVFLATKSHDYTYDGTMRLVDQSLHRLQTDYIDLYQHHFVGHFGQLEDLQKENSARQAFERLKDEGVIGNIGVTGHSSRILSDALQDYPYDCALITINAAQVVMDDTDQLDRFFEIAKEKEVGVIAMKVANRGRLLEKGLSIRQLLPYTMSYPVSTTIMGISAIPHLEEDVRIASSFEQLSEEEMAEIRAVAQG